MNSLFKNNSDERSSFREIQLHSRVSRWSSTAVRSYNRDVYSRFGLARTIFLFAPFTSVSLSCLRRFSIQKASIAPGGIVLIESYVGLFDILHRIFILFGARLLQPVEATRSSRLKLFLGRACACLENSSTATSRQEDTNNDTG